MKTPKFGQKGNVSIEISVSKKSNFAINKEEPKIKTFFSHSIVKQMIFFSFKQEKKKPRLMKN